METSRLWVSGYIGPAIAPWIARNMTSMPRLVEMPQQKDAIENSSVAHTKVFTSPKRRDRKPVSGSAIALATVNEVITHTDWFWLAPRLPAMVGSETLAMVRSSTCMKVPSDSPIVASGRLAGRNSPKEPGWAEVEDIRILYVGARVQAINAIRGQELRVARSCAPTSKPSPACPLAPRCSRR